MDEVVGQKKDKSSNSLRRFFKPCCTLIWNCKLFPRASKSLEKSRARTTGKILRELQSCL